MTPQGNSPGIQRDSVFVSVTSPEILTQKLAPEASHSVPKDPQKRWESLVRVILEESQGDQASCIRPLGRNGRCGLSLCRQTPCL